MCVPLDKYIHIKCMSKDLHSFSRWQQTKHTVATQFLAQNTLHRHEQTNKTHKHTPKKAETEDGRKKILNCSRIKIWQTFNTEKYYMTSRHAKSPEKNGSDSILTFIHTFSSGPRCHLPKKNGNGKGNISSTHPSLKSNDIVQLVIQFHFVFVAIVFVRQ